MVENNIQIDTGIVEITVNGDPTRIIRFNPEDVLFVERFYHLTKLFEEKEKEYLSRAEELSRAMAETDSDLESESISANTPAALELVKDLCEFLCTNIDKVFGAGTSEAAFQGAQTLNMFEQFFAGITPYIRKSREAKTVKYISKKGKKS